MAEMSAAQYINADSGDFEYFTPSVIVEAAREVMGVIHLDPASSAIANERVRAMKYFTKEDNGLAQQWAIHQHPVNVWMNHPFGRGANKLWIEKLISSYNHGWIDQACCITFSSTSEAWFQPLLDFPICFIAKRVNYYLPNGEIKRGVTKGSCVTYLGPYARRFTTVFSKLGKVMIPSLV